MIWANKSKSESKQRKRSNGRKRRLLLEKLSDRLPFAAGVAPTIDSVELNEGESQRSMLTSVTVNFSDEVTFLGGNPSDAFVLTNLETLKPVESVVASTQSVNGASIVTLTFAPGDLVYTRSVLPNTLEEGNYRLDVLADKIIANSLQLDGNGDGVVGDDFIVGDLSSDQWFRFFGDTDGDRDVDGQDYGRFGLTFLKPIGNPSFNPALDFDGDGDVDGQDYGQFGLRFLQSQPHDVATAIRQVSLSVSENVAGGTSVGTVSSDITSAMLGIIGGNLGDTFSITSSGELSVSDPSLLNHETVPQFVISVLASNGTQTEFIDVFVDILDVAEAPTAINSELSVSQNAGAGTVLGNAIAYDEDFGPSPAYTMAGFTGPNGSSNPFAVDSGTGQVTVAYPEFLTSGSYTLDIEASDADAGTANTSFQVTVSVNAPNVENVQYDLYDYSI